MTVTTVAGGVLVSRYRDAGFAVLATIFAGYVLSANIFVPRLVVINLGISEFTLTTGSIIWPFTAQIQDMINETYGRKKALISVGSAFLVNLLFITFVYVGRAVPAVWDVSAEEFWREYFSSAPRIFFASWATFIVAQGVDIAVFSRLKEQYRRLGEENSTKRIVLYSASRSMASDLVNMTIDAALFAFLAFAFTLPWKALWDLILGSIAVKVILSLLDTPWFLGYRLIIRGTAREK